MLFTVLSLHGNNQKPIFDDNYLTSYEQTFPKFQYFLKLNISSLPLAEYAIY